MRLGFAFLFPFFLLAACGGRATRDAVDHDLSDAAGGAATGGVVTGGVATGGVATGGAVGSAGAPPVGTECTASPEPGTCDLESIQYRHDPALGLCVPHLFNACDTSPNRYATREQCAAACRGGEPELDACAADADCVLGSLDCCGPCEPLSAEQFVAINANRRAELRELTGCGDVACEQCLPLGPSESTERYLYARCEAGQCTVRDLRERAVARCDSAADCRLRCGTDCCEGCTPEAGVVALRLDADVGTELCDGAAACDDCACEIPPEYAADCVEGRCTAVIGPVCQPGADQTCNVSEIMSSIAGVCNPDGTCTCEPFAVDLVTGRCY